MKKLLTALFILFLGVFSAKASYNGNFDIAFNTGFIIGIILVYGVIGIIVSIFAGTKIASIVVGLIAGIQTWVEEAEQYAQSYVKSTGDYTLRYYDKTNDLQAFFLGVVVFFTVFFIAQFLLTILKNAKKAQSIKKKEAKTTPFKIEIVNNEKYIGLKKSDRVAFLKGLKKQTLKELSEQRKEIETEQAKLKDIPADVAKYIKQKDMSELEKNISRLENKIIAIDELIESETTNK